MEATPEKVNPLDDIILLSSKINKTFDELKTHINELNKKCKQLKRPIDDDGLSLLHSFESTPFIK